MKRFFISVFFIIESCIYSVSRRKTVFIPATLFLQVGMLTLKPKCSENNIGSIQLTLLLLTNRFSLMHFHRPILYTGQNIHAF